MVEYPVHTRSVTCSSQVAATRPVGQAVKTPPFHGGNMGSIPVRVTKKEDILSDVLFFCLSEQNPRDPATPKVRQKVSGGHFLDRRMIPVRGTIGHKYSNTRGFPDQAGETAGFFFSLSKNPRLIRTASAAKKPSEGFCCPSSGATLSCWKRTSFSFFVAQRRTHSLSQQQVLRAGNIIAICR